MDSIEPLRWTNYKPTVPGWYWYRDLRGRSEIHELRMELGEMMMGDDLYVQFMDGDFAGPIPAPVERMTEEQKNRLVELCNVLRIRASKVGPMHSFWDIIFDIESYLNESPMMAPRSASELIAEAEGCIGE